MGIYVLADGVTLANNRVFDEGADGNPFGYDVGLGNYGTGNAVTNTKARGFAIPYDGVAASGGKGRNKAIPAPQD